MVEHAVHLPHCDHFIREELQPLLTENYVKAGILQSKIERAPFKPFDAGSCRCRERLRNGDHSGI